MLNWRFVLASGWLLLGLLGCNSGSSSSSSTPTPSVNASVDVGLNRSVRFGTTVTLTGTVTKGTYDIRNQLWSQISGPTVTLTTPTELVTSFVAPTVNSDTDLLFLLTVTDSNSTAVSASVTITVLANKLPVSDAGADFSVATNAAVTLNGTASDSDGSIVSYAWTQISGSPTVTLNNANTVSANFTAPASASTLGFRLTTIDNDGGSASDDVLVTVATAQTSVTISGKATYDFIEHNSSSNALNLSTPVVSNVRGATVELVDSANTVLASTQTDSNGQYSFSGVGINLSGVKVRVKAQLLKTGSPSWDFRVVDNTNSKALYSMVTSSFNTGVLDQTKNLHAAVGSGNTYLTVRAAGPFAIIDDVYKIIQKILSADANFQFHALPINWSVNNVAASGSKPAGQIGTSHFDGSEIYILGKADNDTDEFDDHVVIHEWGHYFEGFHSRSDSIGGQHGGGDKLDIRVAFGEGFGNAWSGIVTDDPIYRDSNGTNSASGFSINVDSNANTAPGWADESVVQGILYDLYDSGTETGDAVALGVKPLFDTLIAEEKNTSAFTSIFSFIAGLDTRLTAGEWTDVNTLITSRSISTISDEYGQGESHDGGNAKNLPVYFTLLPGNTVSNVCSNVTYGDYNKLGVHRFIHFTLLSNGSYTLSVPSLGANSDPDFYVYKNGVGISGDLGAAHGANVTESWTSNLQAGDYVVDVYEYFNVDNSSGNERESCFSVSLN